MDSWMSCVTRHISSSVKTSSILVNTHINLLTSEINFSSLHSSHHRRALGIKKLAEDTKNTSRDFNFRHLRYEILIPFFTCVCLLGSCFTCPLHQAWTKKKLWKPQASRWMNRRKRTAFKTSSQQIRKLKYPRSSLMNSDELEQTSFFLSTVKRYQLIKMILHKAVGLIDWFPRRGISRFLRSQNVFLKRTGNWISIRAIMMDFAGDMNLV